MLESSPTFTVTGGLSGAGRLAAAGRAAVGDAATLGAAGGATAAGRAAGGAGAAVWQARTPAMRTTRTARATYGTAPPPGDRARRTSPGPTPTRRGRVAPV